MIGYATVGTNDVAKALPFYDAVLGEMGAQKAFDSPKGGRLYSRTPGKFEFSVTPPFDGSPATAGNGTMIALAADTQEQVRNVHAKAIELGGTDEGAPGQRWPGFYAAYFRDLDGNKLNCCYMGE